MNAQLKYSHSVVWSEEDQEFVASSPEFPGLSALAADPVEAVRELHEAIEVAVRAFAEDGETPPPPRTLADYSGQLRVRLGRSLHAEAVARAEQDGLSLNAFIQAAVARAVGSSMAFAQAANELRAATRALNTSLGTVSALEQAAQARSAHVYQTSGDAVMLSIVTSGKRPSGAFVTSGGLDTGTEPPISLQVPSMVPTRFHS